LEDAFQLILLAGACACSPVVRLVFVVSLFFFLYCTIARETRTTLAEAKPDSFFSNTILADAHRSGVFCFSHEPWQFERPKKNANIRKNANI